MKINWFCPLLPEKTDIAHYTSRVLDHLTERVEIVLWTTQESWLPELEEQAVVRQFDPENPPSKEIENGDINIYHIGNNATFHGSIWKISCQYPGIVVLHDVNLHYLFTSLFPKHGEPGPDREAYKELMLKHHGTHCKQDLDKFFKGELEWGDMAERYPLTFAALDNATGAIVHNQEALALLKSWGKLPVLYTPLPYPSEPINTVSESDQKEGEPYQIIIFGHLGGPYRRVQVFLQALSTFPNRSQFRLDIYGEIWDENYIKDLIQRGGIEDLVTLHGFVEEEELDTALANADLAINLRYPSGGEASGSQLRIWSHALPSLVTRIGWYATIPEDAVAFVRHDNEIEDIQQHLANFLANPSEFAAMGEKGREILATEHSPALFAEKVVDFAYQVKNNRDSLVVSSQPQVSVVIPTYNCAQYLPQAIDSVLEQTYPNYEIIIVDDGSTDETYEVLQPYRDQIRYSRFQTNQGVSIARNRGIEMSRGYFVAFLDADDWLFPDKLEKQIVSFKANPKIGMVNSGFRRVNEQGDLLADIEPWHQISQLNLQAWILYRPVCLSAMMFEHNWLRWGGGFKTELSCAEDIDLIFRLALMGCSADWSPQISVGHRQHQGQMLNDNPVEMVRCFEFVLKDLFEQNDLPEYVSALKDRAIYQGLMWNAFHLYATGNYSSMFEVLQKAFSYTDRSKLDVITESIDYFKYCYSGFGTQLNSYHLGSLRECKQFMFQSI